MRRAGTWCCARLHQHVQAGRGHSQISRPRASATRFFRYSPYKLNDGGVSEEIGHRPYLSGYDGSAGRYFARAASCRPGSSTSGSATADLHHSQTQQNIVRTRANSFGYNQPERRRRDLGRRFNTNGSSFPAPGRGAGLGVSATLTFTSLKAAPTRTNTVRFTPVKSIYGGGQDFLSMRDPGDAWLLPLGVELPGTPSAPRPRRPALCWQLCTRVDAKLAYAVTQDRHRRRGAERTTRSWPREYQGRPADSESARALWPHRLIWRHRQNGDGRRSASFPHRERGQFWFAGRGRKTASRDVVRGVHAAVVPMRGFRPSASWRGRRDESARAAAAGRRSPARGHAARHQRVRCWGLICTICRRTGGGERGLGHGGDRSAWSRSASRRGGCTRSVAPVAGAGCCSARSAATDIGKASLGPGPPARGPALSGRGPPTAFVRAAVLDSRGDPAGGLSRPAREAELAGGRTGTASTC